MNSFSILKPEIPKQNDFERNFATEVTSRAGLFLNFCAPRCHSALISFNYSKWKKTFFFCSMDHYGDKRHLLNRFVCVSIAKISCIEGRLNIERDRDSDKEGERNEVMFNNKSSRHLD